MSQATRDRKLVQYLSEAYGKEKELEAALGTHIQMTDRAPYRKRLQQHLKETRNHARLVERRVANLGGGGHLLHKIAARASAMAKGPIHAMRGRSNEEKLLKNAKSEYSEEAEEIATYTAIETLAEEVGDSETAKMAREIRRQEERMAAFLSRQIPVLTKAVARAEIPANERDGGRSKRARRRTTSRRRGTRARTSGPSSRARAGSRR
jgi:ferritin-like metal-binding protein YciE